MRIMHTNYANLVLWSFIIKNAAIQNIDWLVDSNSDDCAQSLRTDSNTTTRIHFPYPKNIASGHSEHTRGLDGIVVIQDKHDFVSEHCPQTLQLGNISVIFPEPVFFVSTLHEGQLQFTNSRTEETVVRQPGVDLFGHRLDSNLEQIAITAKSIRATHFTIPVSQLSKLLDHETVEIIFERFKIIQTQSQSLQQVPVSISRLLEHCVNHSLRDSLKKIHLQARILDYLCSLSLHLSSNLVKNQNLDLSHARARAVHNFLLTVGSDTPTLRSLSQKFGTSPNKLNAEFMAEYGQSIFSFLTAYRLEQARLAIEKSDLPLKSIAHRVGYSHVNHFNAAFKRKYNQTPGSLRP